MSEYRAGYNNHCYYDPQVVHNKERAVCVTNHTPTITSLVSQHVACSQYMQLQTQTLATH